MPRFSVKEDNVEMKEWRKKMENLVDELRVTREMGRLNFPFQEGSRPFISKIRPQFLVIAGVVALVSAAGALSYFFRRKKG